MAQLKIQAGTLQFSFHSLNTKICLWLTARILLELRSLMFGLKPDNGNLHFNLTFMPNSEKPVWSFLMSKCSKLSLLSGFFYHTFVVNGTCTNLCSFLWWWIGWKGKNCLINEYSFWLCQGKCGITMYRRQVHNTLKIADFFLKSKLISYVYIEISRLLENGADSVSSCSGWIWFPV